MAFTSITYLSINKRMFSGRSIDLSAVSIRISIDLKLPIGAIVDVVIMRDAKRTVFNGYVIRSDSKELVIHESERSNASLRALYEELDAA